METTPLTQESIQNALNQLRDWFPEQAANIEKYNNELVENILEDKEPDPDSPLGKLAEQTASAVAVPVSPGVHTGGKTATALQGMAIPGIVLPQFNDDELFDLASFDTPCNRAVGKAALSAGLFVLSMVGIRAKANDRMYHAFLAEFGPVATKFTRLFQDFGKAESAYEKGKVFFKISGGLLKASCYKAIIKAWAEEADWVDWVTTGALAIAQLTAWFATEGIAFIAEVVLLLGSATSLVIAIKTAVDVCFANDCKPIAAPALTFMPAGSFINTAENVKVTLSAQCKNMAGQYVDATLDITKLAANTQIDNNNGKLVIAPKPGEAATTFIPVGSFRSSAQNIKVTLSASCKNMRGELVESVLNITDLSLKKEIANANGQLKAE